MSYRSAALGIVCGLGFLILFSARVGMSIPVAITFFIIYFTLSIMVTRMRAELGFFTHPMRGIMVPDILVTFAGTRALGKENLTAMTLFRWFNRAFSSHPMPHQLEALKLAKKVEMDSKKLMYGIISITAFGAVSVFWVLLHFFYKFGALSASPTQTSSWATLGGWLAFSSLQNWMSYPTNTDFLAIIFMGVGFTFSAFLSIMRIRFIWWAFHPVGYIVANQQWAMLNFWSCMLVSSVAKWLILKYSGSKGYRKGVMFCAGLILGDFVIGGSWNLIGLLFNIPTYSFWP